MNVAIKLGIIDYSMGNIRSISNAFRQIGVQNIQIHTEPEAIKTSDVLVLPGVGHFKDAMQVIASKGFDSALRDEILVAGKPLLGICLGMQLLFSSSEEGGVTKGLDFISGEVIKIPSTETLRVPHVGWNNISVKKRPELFPLEEDYLDFYFVHSYYAKCATSDIMATFEYGNDYTAAVCKSNIIGTQFHPEKSQRSGLTFLNTFMKYHSRSLSC